MLEETIIGYFSNADVIAVKQFYANTTYKSADSTLPTDKIIAAYHANEIIGLYRLCHEGSTWVLRGFYVLEPYRGKGIGSSMLLKLDEIAMEHDIYLICTKPRNNFYAKAGFTVLLNNVPTILHERMRNYNNPAMNILLRLAEDIH